MEDSQLYCVIGSGPAGISCAMALVAAGKNVMILDSGRTLEEERRTAIIKLSNLQAKDWQPEDISTWRSGMTGTSSGIPLKLAYGSDYPYRHVPGATVIECRGPDTRPSYALGGLGTVWGSAVLPYRQADIPDWPINIQDLEEGYRSVLNWMPLSAQADALSTMFPLHRNEICASLPMSRQAAGVLNRLNNNSAYLNDQGVYFGQSRLAVDADGSRSKSACVRCGLCMYGCPHELIYSTEQTLASLLAKNRVKYCGGVTVQKLQEGSDGVTIHCVDSRGEHIEFRADRVFLGVGVLNTTAILLRSLERYDAEVLIRDSQYFLLPALRFGGTRDVVREPLHTLAQLFVEILDDSISPYTVHLQTYTYNDLFREPILTKLGLLKSMFPLEAFLGRLILFQGYLHSSHSSPISARLTHDGETDILKLESSPILETKRCVNRVATKLLGLARYTGSVPLRPLLNMGSPGRGFHSGGSFPMSRSPDSLQTDIYGRPPGLKRIHAIDSSVLPSIPATTITLTVMANAYRIGAAAARSDGLPS